MERPEYTLLDMFLDGWEIVDVTQAQLDEWLATKYCDDTPFAQVVTVKAGEEELFLLYGPGRVKFRGGEDINEIVVAHTSERLSDEESTEIFDHYFPPSPPWAMLVGIFRVESEYLVQEDRITGYSLIDPTYMRENWTNW